MRIQKQPRIIARILPFLTRCYRTLNRDKWTTKQSDAQTQKDRKTRAVFLNRALGIETIAATNHRPTADAKKKRGRHI
jgi:hypothetical protein